MKTVPSAVKVDFAVVGAELTEIRKGVFIVPTDIRIFYFCGDVSERWMYRSVEVYQDSELVEFHPLSNVELDEWHRVSCLDAPVWLQQLVQENIPVSLTTKEW